MRKISRRSFIRSAALSSAGLLTAGPLSGCFSRCPRNITSVNRERRVLADLHVHPTLNEWLRRTPQAIRYPILAKIAEFGFNPTGVTWKTSYQAGIDLMCASHFNVFDEWLSMRTDPNPAAPRNAMLMFDLLEEQLAGPAQPYAKLARNHLELKKMLEIPKSSKDWRIAVLHSLEGGHALGGNIEWLDEFARRGVVLITLTHFFNKGIASAPNAYPFFPDSNSPWPLQGLTDFGREVIKKMEEIGMLIDVTHTTSTALADVLAATTNPVVATHSSVRTLGDHAYSFFDEHIQEIARRGGLIGVILFPHLLSNYTSERTEHEYGSLGDVVRTIRYIAKICGTHKHVAIGSDFEGFISAPKEMKCLGKIDYLRQLLLKEFDHDQNVVEDIMANNTIEFILKNWRSGV